VYPCQPIGEGTAGERWVAIACMTDAQWQQLRGVLGDPVWAQDLALTTASGRVAAARDLDARIAEWTRAQAAEAVMARCQAAGVPAGVVQDGLDLTERDPQLAHARFIRPVDDPDDAMGPMSVDRLPLRFEKTPCETYRRVRRVGEDNASVLRDWLGMDAEEVQRREDEGVLK
jgi:benzylsuccinate CoA-transferase BbsF subunit